MRCDLLVVRIFKRSKLIPLLQDGYQRRGIVFARQTIVGTARRLARTAIESRPFRPMPRSVPALVRRAFGRLRYPKLLALTATLFLVDLVVPDVIPFVDEILLGLGTLLLTQLRQRRTDEGGTAR